MTHTKLQKIQEMRSIKLCLFSFCLQSRSESMASVYSQEGGRYGTVDVRGDVEFGMSYSLNIQSLELHIKQCRDLACVDAKRNRSDPYVKLNIVVENVRDSF